MAFAANLDSSDDHRPTVKIRSLLITHKPALVRKVTYEMYTYGTQLA